MIERVRKRWMLSTDGGVTFDQILSPLNTQSIKFAWTRDLKAGQIFGRWRLTSPLRFGKPDFDLLYNLERTPVRRCNDLYVRQDRLCEGQWIHWWTGRFSVGGGKFDHDACQAEFKPEVFDKYTCILDHLEDKVNLMDIAPVDVEAHIFPSNIEFLLCDSEGDSADCTAAFSALEGWESLPVPSDPASVSLCLGIGELNVFAWREKIATNCVAGLPVPPPGAGWSLLTNNCAVDGTAIYVRQPVLPWTYGDLVPTQTSTPTPVEPPGACGSWILLGSFFCDPLAPQWTHFWMCPYAGTPEEYETGRTFESIVDYMLERTGCEIDGVVSDFFEINPPGDAAGYVAGDNYVTGTTNQVDHLVMLQKSDAKDPAATNPATRGEWTLKALFEFLRAGPRVYWDIDDDNNLRLEHWKYFVLTQGLDITTGENYDLNRGMNRYEHLSESIPKYERLTFAEAQGDDFVGKDVIYDSPCVQSEGSSSVEETRIPSITTDIGFVLADPTAINNEGFVLLACTEDAGVFTVIIDDGAITGSPVTNSPVSKANLQRDYWTWDRYLKRGNMNGADVIFDGIVPNIQQPDLKVRFCCGMEDWEPRDTIKTELGERFLQHRQAQVEKAELEDFDDRLTITPRYAY